MANIKELIQSIESTDSSFDEKLEAINKMEETLVAMRQQEEKAVQDNVDLIVEAIKVMENKVTAQLEVAKSIVPVKGDKGDKGDRGLDGRQGIDGKNGQNGVDGKDGIDGKDGVSVSNAQIDFDGSLVITLSTGQEINVGEVVAPELQERIKLVTSGGAGTVLPTQTGNANKYLKTDGTALSWAAGDGTGTVTSVGGTGTVNGLSLSGTVTTSGNLTLGGTLDLSSPPAIGATSPSTGRFTTVTSTVATGTAPFTVTSTTPVTNLSIGGNAGTVTNGVYTTDTGTVTNTMLAGSIANAKLTNSNITFGSTSQALGSTVSGLSGVTIDNGVVGGTTPAAVTATTLIGGGGSANYGQLTGGATTKAVQFQTLGSDTNVSLAVQPKGTGAIDLAAGSSGVNISNGGTVTAITGTTTGSYTVVPTITISVPTTAGGTQATGSVAMQAITVTLQSGGSGYAIGDTITLTGGTFTQAVIVTVATLSGSAVATFTTSSAGTYTFLPTNPVAQGSSSGAGTGATFNITAYGVRTTAYTITGAGSGYVEQPTVTFSSGSATAYATVGSGTIIRSLGATGTQSLDFYTPQGITSSIPAMRIRDNVSDSYPMINNLGGLASFVAQGNSTASLGLASNGSGNIRFYTNGTTFTEQMRVSHTTSAVNYVQVTGGATGINPSISSQGSDSNVGITLTTKGTFGLTLKSSAGGNIFTATHGNSATSNYLTFNATVSGSQPTISVANSVDADVDIVFTPKGAGAVRFGTYTASVLTPTGYITIKDSGGTSRRLLVG